MLELLNYKKQKEASLYNWYLYAKQMRKIDILNKYLWWLFLGFRQWHFIFGLDGHFKKNTFKSVMDWVFTYWKISIPQLLPCDVLRGEAFGRWLGLNYIKRVELSQVGLAPLRVRLLYFVLYHGIIIQWKVDRMIRNRALTIIGPCWHPELKLPASRAVEN